MGILETLNNKHNELENRNNEVINEIVDYFKEKLYSEEYISKLQKMISYREEYILKKRFESSLELWLHNEGCSDTNIYAFGVVWENPDNDCSINSWYYKGVYLRDIQDNVCDKILTILVLRLTELGFKVSYYDNRSWLNYYRKKIVITW